MTDRRPTILQIIPRLDTGGAELATIEITEAVVRAGGSMLVATEGGRLAPKITSAGGELIAFPAATKNPAKILANGLALAELVRDRQVALIHARSRAPAWSALIAKRRSGVSLVATYHGAYAENNPIKQLYNSVMARTDIVIANSRYTADLIRQRYRTPEARLRVIHRGVDLATFHPEMISPERVNALRTDWQLTGTGPVILQAARLTSWKGQRVLIEAAGLLAQNGTLGEAVVVLAGDAQEREGYVQDLRALALSYGLTDRIKLVGHVSDIAAAYVIAHVTVVASTKPEAFGRAATEAEAMGCPVIATATGAPPETILAPPGVPAGEATGWLVPPGNARALANHLERALGLSAAEREAMGARARTHVARHFTLETMKRQTLAVYDELLGTSLSQALQ